MRFWNMIACLLLCCSTLHAVNDWSIQLDDEVRNGDTLERILERFELERRLLPGLVKAYDSIHDHRRIRPGERIALLRQDDSGALAIAHWLKPWLRLRVMLPDSQSRSGDLDWHATADTLKAGLACKVIEGELVSSLYESILNAGGSAATVLAYTDIFQWDVDFFTEVRPGHLFQLVLEERHYEGAWLEEALVVEGRIMSASYTRGEEDLQASWFDGCETKGYFNGEARSFQKQFLKSPLNFRRVSSRFGKRRHPVTRKYSNHPGVDFAAAKGTPIVAPADGVITTAGVERFYGKVLRIRHNERFLTVYGHLSKFGKGIQKGTRVTQNQVIGYVGATGRATGPHLHYEFHDRGRLVDPLKVKHDPAQPLPDACREEFLKLHGRWWPAE